MTENVTRGRTETVSRWCGAMRCGVVRCDAVFSRVEPRAERLQADVHDSPVESLHPQIPKRVFRNSNGCFQPSIRP